MVGLAKAAETTVDSAERERGLAVMSRRDHDDPPFVVYATNPMVLVKKQRPAVSEPKMMSLPEAERKS